MACSDLNHDSHFIIFSPPVLFLSLSTPVWWRLRHWLWTRFAAKEETAQEPNHLHSRTAGRIGACLWENPLPWYLHPGGAGTEGKAHWGPRAGTAVAMPSSCLIQAGNQKGSFLLLKQILNQENRYISNSSLWIVASSTIKFLPFSLMSL